MIRSARNKETKKQLHKKGQVSKMEKKILSENELNQVAGGSGASVLASGSFASSTGTQLNLLVN